MSPPTVKQVSVTLKPDFSDLIKTQPDTALQQANVANRTFIGTSVNLHELTGTSMFRVHSLQDFDRISDAMSTHGIVLPDVVNQSLGQDPAIMCLAPGEWLLYSEYLGAIRLFEQIQSAADIPLTVIVNLSASLSVFRLGGCAVPWLLNKLCSLDFQSSQEPHAYCARTRLQQAGVILHYHQPGGLASEFVYDIIIERSIALYAWQLLIASIPHAEELEQQFGTKS